MNVRLHTEPEHKHETRVADVVRISTRKPQYLPSVQEVIQAQVRNVSA